MLEIAPWVTFFKDLTLPTLDKSAFIDSNQRVIREAMRHILPS
jgi:hypothetical protein